MRRLLALVSLAGCDVVFGLEENKTADSVLESATHDEDGDQIADRFDLCPHQAAPEMLDTDDDGIGDRCDPRKTTPDLRFFIAFENGDAGVLLPRGSLATEPDALVVGSITSEGGFLLDMIVTDTADIEADLEIVETKALVGEYAEVGLFTVHRSFLDGGTERGDVCFFGTDDFDRTPPIPRNFLEFEHDDSYRSDLSVRFDGTVVGVRGRLSHARSPQTFACAFASTTLNQGNSGAQPTDRGAVTGKIAVTTHFLRARFHYLWIVTPRPSPASP